MLSLANQSAELSPDFLSEVVLWALSLADVSMVIVLAFVLARNIIKLVVERRRGLPFARFRSKLVAALLLMTIVPALLVLFVGSELLRNSANRWFSAPIDEVLGLGAGDRQRVLPANAAPRSVGTPSAWRHSCTTASLDPQNVGTARDLASSYLREGRLALVQIYRVVPGAERVSVEPLVDVASPDGPRVSPNRATADRLAAQAVAGTLEATLSGAARRRRSAPAGRGRDPGRVGRAGRRGGGRATT